MMYIGRDRMVVFTTTYAQRRLNSIIGPWAKQCTVYLHGAVLTAL